MSRRRRKPIHHFFFLFCIACLLLLLCFPTSSASSSSPEKDARALLAFKSMADLNGNLKFEQNTSSHFCQWLGVTCVREKMVRLVLEGLDLGGVFAPNTLTRLDQLRVLSLQNNSLAGPIPNLSGLLNLKSLFLDHNSFTGFFPPSISLLHRIRTLDFSYNNLTGPIPPWLIDLDRLYYLRLEWNRFNGTVPPLNQSSLQTFNISGNSLSGAIPVTSTFLHFGPSSFSWNPNLCGEIIHKECHPGQPFFRPSAEAAPPPVVALGQTVQVGGVELTQPCQQTNHRRTMVIIGFSSGIFVLIGSLLLFLIAFRKQKNRRHSKALIMAADEVAVTACAMQMEQETELEEKVKRVQEMQVGKSGSLVFSAGEAQVYTLDQLMRASAEMLGRGTVGTTYKAVLDNRLIVCVKRLDAGKLAGTSKETFEQHMESVGGLRHPNLVPLRAYFQAKEERLLIYDYQPNGSLSSLIHGSKSTRAKPLHWTSCLKIAEDVAQGLSYIHQAWRLVHGNLKSSNVLLGPDFEACVADYCLAVLATTTSDDPDFTSYKAPEIRNSNRPATPKSDVYAFGILLLELLTGKPPSQNPFWGAGEELMDWVKSVREDDGGGEDERLAMLLEVAIDCTLSSPEQRPTMWQVLKMIQEIKEVVLMEDSELESPAGTS